jgi:hypothetical protein
MKWVRVSCGESKFEFLVDWGVYIINVWLYIFQIRLKTH